MRPIYVQTDDLTPDQVSYVRYETEAALSIGALRLPTPASDLSKLQEAAALYQKIAAEADKAFRDLQARIGFLNRQEEQRRLASAAAVPCRCGEPAAPYMVHRQDAPCHRVDNPPCQNCQGHGCPDCSGHGIAAVNPPPERPAEQTRNLQAVDGDARAPMPSTTVFTPPARPTPGQ